MPCTDMLAPREHLLRKTDAAVDFALAPEDLEALKKAQRMDDYGAFNVFPVFSGKPLA